MRAFLFWLMLALPVAAQTTNPTFDRYPTPSFKSVTAPYITPGCKSNAGQWTGNGLATWIPSCLGVWSAIKPSDTLIFATRGTTSTSGTYPPAPDAGTPITNGGTNLLIQTRADGATSFQTSGAFINLDVVGGKASQDHPSDELSPNATGLLISGSQRPGPNGERAPTSWTLNTDHVIGIGSGNTQSYNVEWDLSNFNADCGVGVDAKCLSAWHFYGGINAYPNTAFHLFGNPKTESYIGTGTTAGNVLTLSTGRLGPLVARIDLAGQNFRVDCTTTTCTADRPFGTNTTPLAFVGHSAMAHYGLLWQDSPLGTQVQDHDMFFGDSARNLLTAAGNHRVGIDFTQDQMPYAAFFKSGQQVCYNGAAMCMSHSTALNAFMFAPGLNQAAAVARIDSGGNLTMNGTLTASGNVSTGSYFASGVAGVSCNGPPTSQFQVVGGIVTRC